MKKLIYHFLALSYLFLISGIGLIVAHFFFGHKAATGGGVPPQSELKVVEGKVVAGRDVTIETKRRRGVDSKERFYEFDVQTADGKMLQLRVDHSIPKSRLEPILDETIQAKYDSSDDNIAYNIAMNGQDVVVYKELAEKAQEKANKQADFFSDGAMLKAGIQWLIMGLIGLGIRHWLSRSLKALPATVRHTPTPLDTHTQIKDKE